MPHSTRPALRITDQLDPRTALLLTAAVHRDPAHARRAWQQLADDVTETTESTGVDPSHDGSAHTDTYADTHADTHPRLHLLITWLQSGPQQRLMPLL